MIAWHALHCDTLLGWCCGIVLYTKQAKDIVAKNMHRCKGLRRSAILFEGTVLYLPKKTKNKNSRSRYYVCVCVCA